MSPFMVLFALGAWAGLAAISLGAGLAPPGAVPGPVPWPDLVRVELLSVGLWVGLTLPVVRLVGELPAPPRRWLRSLAGQLAVGLPFVLLAAVLDAWLAVWLVPEAQLPTVSALLPRLDARLATYLAFVTLVQSTRYFQLYRDRELRAAELEARLARTKLQVLKMQLQPHFLFNTLHTTAELVHANPDAADAMITRLGDFLRLSLAHAGHQVVPLRQELDFIRAYVEIEQLRYGDRLQVTWANAPDTLDAAVPTLLWQPVLENAIRHGRDPVTGEARVEVGARRDRGDVVLWVRDHGPGIGTGAGSEVGVRENLGLRNTRERVEQLYGDTGRFVLTDAVGGGAIAQLRIPYVACTQAHTPLPLRLSEPAALLR